MGFHQDFNSSPLPPSSMVDSDFDRTFAYPTSSLNQMLAPSPSFWSPTPRGLGADGISSASSPATSSSHYHQIQPQMTPRGDGQDSMIRLQGIQNDHHQEENNNDNQLHIGDLGGGTGDIVTPRPPHQCSVPNPLPQSLELMAENAEGGIPVGNGLNRLDQELMNGVYRSANQEEGEDSIMNSPPRGEEDPQSYSEENNSRDSINVNHNHHHHHHHHNHHHHNSSSSSSNGFSTPSAGAPNETINQIGQLLDQVVNLANSAREHFKQGEHSSSSHALTDIQRSLAHIGELGSQSLASVQQGKIDNPVSPPVAPPQTHRRTDTASSLSSAVNSPHSRKRPIDEDDDRSPPSANPSDLNPHSSQSSSDLRSNALTPIQPPSAPPSAPPNMLAASSASLQANVMAASNSNPAHQRPGIFHTVSASQVPQLQNLPPNGFQQQLQYHQQSFPSTSGSQSVPGSYASSPTVEQGFIFPDASIQEASQQARPNHRQLPQLATGSPKSPAAGSGILSASSGGGGSLLQQSFASSMPPSPVDRSSAASSSLRDHSRSSSLAGAVSPTQQLHQQQGNHLVSMANEASASPAGTNGASTGGHLESLQMALQSEAQAREDFNKAQSKHQQQQQQQQQQQSKQQNLDLGLGFGFDLSSYQNDRIGTGVGGAPSDNASFSAPSSPRDDSYSSWSNTNADSTDFDEMGGFESSHSSFYKFGGGHVGTDLEDNDYGGGQQQFSDMLNSDPNLNSSESNGVPSELSLPGSGIAPSPATTGSVSGSSSGIGPRRSPRQTIRAQQVQGRKGRSYSSPRNPLQSLSSHTIKGHRPQRSEASPTSMISSFQSQLSDDNFTPRLKNDKEENERTLRAKRTPARSTANSRRARSIVRKNEDSEDEDGVEDEDEESDEDEEVEEHDNHEHEVDEEGEGMGISIENVPEDGRKIPHVSPEIKVLFDSVFRDFLAKVCSDPLAADNSGQTLSMTLMPQRVADMPETPDFNTFKFRIQPFSDAFESELLNRGVDPQLCNTKNTRTYLRNQTLIGRFNEDGKKNKTKGTTVWIVEAKKLPDSSWQFREFTPKFARVERKTAYVGENWNWTLRVWDPQAPLGSVKAVYEVEAIPDWIHVPKKVSEAPTVLSGVPSANDVGSKKVQVTAVYRAAGHLHRLRHSFFLQVADKKALGKRVSRSRNAASTSHSTAIAQSSKSSASASESAPHPSVDATEDSDNRSIHTIRPDEISSNDSSDRQQQQQQQQQETQSMEGIESFIHETLPPSQVSAFVSSLPFQVPFTPPIVEGKKDYLNLGQQAQISAAQQAQAQAQAQVQAQVQEPNEDQLAQMKNMAERQQHNASQLMLSLPMHRRNGMSSESMSPNSQSPMSSMPQQMQSTLPMASSSYSLPLNSSDPNITPGLSHSHNPTLSPALDLANFNPLGELPMDRSMR